MQFAESLLVNAPLHHQIYMIVDVEDLKCLNEAYQADTLTDLVHKIHSFGHQVFQFDTAKEMYQWALESL